MRDSARSAAIAALAIVAVAVVAATVESTLDPERGGPDGPGESSGAGDGGLLPAPRNATAPGEALQIPFMSELITVLAVLAGLALLVYLYVYWRRAIVLLVAVIAVIGVLYVLFAVFGSQADPTSAPAPRLGNGSPLGGGGGGGGGSETGSAEQPSLPSVLLLLALIAALFGTVLAYLRASSPDDDPADDRSMGRNPDTAAVGEAAGRAADRLEEDTHGDNEVYRAWGEMTALLDIPDPETSTPGDFETAAVEAGMDGDDVRELTRLFENVRYGSAEPSADREERAIGIFRRIEARYAEDEP